MSSSRCGLKSADGILKDVPDDQVLSSENENNPTAHHRTGLLVFRSFCNASVVYLCEINRRSVRSVSSVLST